MTLLKAYLSTPRAQRALTKKPGEQGFSLIELVVVVAVLAILSAIAIPQFSSISAQAAHAAATNTLATVAKECAVKFAQSAATPTYGDLAGGNGVHYNTTDTNGIAGASCGTSAAPATICSYVSSGVAASYCVKADGTKVTGALTSGNLGAALAGWVPNTSDTPPNADTW